MIPDNAEWSEEPWMDQVVAVSQIQIHKIPLLADTIVDHFASAVWHMDQPTPGATAAALMELARAAKPRVTVLLSGEGADELLGGYAKYAQAAFRERLGGPLLALLRHAPGRGRRFGSLLGDRWGETDRVGAFISAGAMERRDLRALRPAVDTSALVDRRRKVFGESTGDFVADALKYDLRTYCVGLLVEQDKMTMASSVENRLPFLDHELVEFVRGLPSSNLVRSSWRPRWDLPRNTKRLLKHRVAARFGDKFAYRAKIGFNLPVHEYINHPEFRRSMDEDLLPSIRDRRLVDGDAVANWWEGFKEARNVPSQTLLTVAALEVWARQTFDGERPQQLPAAAG